MVGLMESPRIHVLDLQFRGQPGLIAAYAIELGDEVALVECGPESTLPALLQGLQACGIEPARVRHVLLTHIHLDHAGAAGWWAQQHGSRIYAHPVAQRHLLDPSRLMAGAHEVYGEATPSLWGAMQPVPAAQLQGLGDGEVVNLAGIELQAWDTPGHARHHLVYRLGDTAFTGDVAGMRLQHSDYLSPTTAPSQFELGPYLKSIERLQAAGLERLGLTHFGWVQGSQKVASHLSAYAARLQEITTALEAEAAAGLSLDELRQRHTQREKEQAMAQGLVAADWQRVELANPASMGADGILQGWQRRAARTP